LRPRAGPPAPAPCACWRGRSVCRRRVTRRRNSSGRGAVIACGAPRARPASRPNGGAGRPALRATTGDWRMRRAGASGSMDRRAGGISMASSPDIPAPSLAYAELQVTSNFSFLRGASHPQELAIAASALGLSAFALTDRNSLAGVVRAHVAAKETGIPFIVGCRLDFRCGRSLLAYPIDRAAYGRLSRLITLGRRRAPKGECHLDLADLESHGEGLILIVLPEEAAAQGEGLASLLAHPAGRLPGHVYLAGQHLYRGDDSRRLTRLARLAEHCATPLVAVNDVHA